MRNDKAFACALTMVRDDYFFLERWVDYYGGQFGRSALYIVNHGGNPRVAEIAQGCNVITIPDVFNEKFDMMRWRMLSNFANGLRSYYNFVVVGDVDEFVVPDPKLGVDLVGFLERRRGKVTITPVGLEVVHHPDHEPEEIGDGPMIGPRKFVRFSTAYSKPCIITHDTRISRGGHYTKDPDLKLFKNLYLFHMRYVDAALYRDTLNRRASRVDEAAQAGDTSMISWNWRRDLGRDDPYARVLELPIEDEFDVTDAVEQMQSTWAPRGDEGLYAFERNIGQTLMTLPPRFRGAV